MIVTRMIPSRTTFLVVYEAVVLTHVTSTFDQEEHEVIHVHSIEVVVMATSSI